MQKATKVLGLASPVKQRPMDTRAVPTVELTDVYRQTQFDPAKFSQQLCYDLGQNPSEVCPGGAYRLNNQTRQHTSYASQLQSTAA